MAPCGLLVAEPWGQLGRLFAQPVIQGHTRSPAEVPGTLERPVNTKDNHCVATFTLYGPPPRPPGFSYAFFTHSKVTMHAKYKATWALTVHIDRDALRPGNNLPHIR